MSDATSYVVLGVLSMVVVVSNVFILLYFMNKLRRIEKRT